MIRYFLCLFLFLGVFWIHTLEAQTRKLSGVVTDTESEPLVGAGVSVKDADPQIATLTDAFGKWELTVPENTKILVFSYTGYAAQELELGASNQIDVALAEGVTGVDVLVTGMGISREEKTLGYAVGKVSGSQIAGSGENNSIQGLAGKVSGIQVIGSGGTPGASSKILIRGNATFTGNNQPLMVVDGVPYDNETSGAVAGDNPFNANLEGVNNSNRALDLNPDDIESMTILKGPAAAVLYGTRASNGVLVVTTKKGKMGKTPNMSVSFNSTIDISQVNKLPEIQQKYSQGVGGGDWKYDADGNYVLDANGNRVFNGDNGEYTTNGLNGGIGTPNSWGVNMDNDTFGLTPHDNYSNFFKTGVSYNNNLSIAGGNQFSAFRLSYGNTKQEGVVPNTSLNRNTLRLNSQIGTDKFIVNATAAYTNTRSSKAQNGSNLSGAMLGLTRMPSSFDILGGTGANGYENLDGTSHTYFDAYDNPIWSAYKNPSTDNVNRFTGNVQLKYIPFKTEKHALTLTYRLGTDAYDDVRKQIFEIGARNSPTQTGEIWENTQRWVEINSDFLVNYTRDFSKDFNLAVLVGNNLNHRKSQNLFSRGRDFAVPGFYNLSNASELYASQTSEFKRLAGMFFDINAGYKNMLYLNVSGRHDWASTFGADIRNKGFFYPATSLSFVFTEVLPKNKILSFGKLRASIARTGIEPAPYGTKTYFNRPFITDGFTNGLSFPYLGQNGFGYSSALGNSALRPELVTGIETGLDLRFMDGRISLDFTYYNQTSSQLLVDRPIATSSGFKSLYSNAGRMRNQGVELELSGTAIKTKNFGWDISVNFTANRNKVLALAEGVDKIEFETTFSGIGAFAIQDQPYGVLYGTVWERKDGKLLIDDAGLPIIAEKQDKVGNPYPQWTAGIRNSFTIYGVNISALLDIRQGGDLWGGTYARLTRLGQTMQTLDRNRTYVIEGVKADGTTNTTPVSALDYFQYYKGDFGALENAIYKGSWVRLRELTISYALPAVFKGVKGLEKTQISVFATGRNLWLKTSYPGVDPETSLTGAGSNVGGFDYFNMPNTRSFMFGIRLNY